MSDSEMSHKRCPHDDWVAGMAKIGMNPDTGEHVELDMNEVAAVVALQSAFLTVGASMRNGHKDDFLAKIALALFAKIESDPHSLCPVLSICSMLFLMIENQWGVAFKDGKVLIQPPDVELNGGDTCMYENEEDDDGSDEETMGGDGAGPSGEGDGAGGEGFGPA